MKRFLGPALLLGLLHGTLYGQSFGASADGTSSADFLQLGVGGRAMGMGGAYSAVADGADALYWNPAGLTHVEGGAATFMHAAYLQSTYFDYAAYAQNLGRAGAFGVGLQYLNAGSIVETDNNFNSVGSFTPYDLAVSAGYALRLDGLGLEGYSIGGAVKYVKSHILHTAQTEAGDFGAMSPDYFGKLKLAVVATNIGGTLKYMNTAENLPMTFKAGAAYRVTPRWLLSMDADLPRHSAPYFAAGTEYVLPVRDDWTMTGRLGYSSLTLGDVSGITGLSVGVGFGTKSMNLDYAFVPYGGLGITNRISISVKFGKSRKRTPSSGRAASHDGSVEYNQIISEERAAAARDILFNDSSPSNETGPR